MIECSTPRLSPCTLCALVLGAILASAAHGQAVPPPEAPFNHDTRAGVIRAAEDPALNSWHRDLMRRMKSTLDPRDDRRPTVARARFPIGHGETADDGVWAELAPPGGRTGHSTTYDPLRRRVLLFAGTDGFPRNDVWTLSLADAHWVQLDPAGPVPTDRVGHSAIYDPVRDRLLVFGGRHGTTYFNDVWELSLDGAPAWSPLSPGGASPSGRFFHSAVYDSVSDRMLIFAGSDGASRLNDVWALSLAGTPTWSQIEPDGPEPGRRFGHAAIGDPARDRMVVFGGSDGSVRNDEVWALEDLDGTPTWRRILAGSPPSARYLHAAILDRTGDRMVVFGGWAGLYLNDVWTLSLSDTLPWESVSPTGTPPAGRTNPGLIYDPVAESMLVFWGYGDAFLSDNAALGLRGLAAWTVFAPPDPAPSGRFGHIAVHDAWNDDLLVFGGSAGGLFGDVWVRGLDETGGWSASLPGTGGRADHSAIFDPRKNRIVVFGGWNGDYLGDLLALELPRLLPGTTGSPVWRELAPGGSPPDARFGHTAIHDPLRDRMLVFGGETAAGLENDVWVLDFADSLRWSPLATSGTPPPARQNHSAVYDAMLDRMLVFGGWNGNALGDVWELSISGTPTWSQLTPLGQPPSARFLHTAIYDPVRDRMVVLGGWDAHELGDVWELSLSGTPTWNELAPAGPKIVVRQSHAAIYDPSRDRMVAFGGYTAPEFPGVPSERKDTWALTWGQRPDFRVTCPPDTLATPGDTLMLAYRVANPYAFSQAFDYHLSVSRSWPGFPRSGTSMVGPNDVTIVTIPVPVPDTAIVIRNELRFDAVLRSVPLRATCIDSLFDPPLLSASPDTLFFMAPANRTTYQDVLARNRGSDTLIIAGIGGCEESFELDTTMTDRVVAPGRTTTIVVGVTPTGGVTDSCTLTIFSNAKNSPTRVPVGVVAVTPSPLTFAGVPRGQTVCDTIHLVNSGPRRFRMLTFTGCTAAPFSLDNSMPTRNVAPGDSTGIRVCVTPTDFDSDSCTITIFWNDPVVQSRIGVRLTGVIGVGSETRRWPFQVFAPSPNPFGAATAVRLTLPAAMPVTAEVWSVTGARVRMLASGRRFAPGEHALDWDGRNDQGSRVAAGIYFIRVRTPHGERTSPAVLLR